MADMSRLITSGCSYTQYCWPTWADYLGHCYDTHLQLGLAGQDCARIARGIIDSEVTPEDTVVICWTGFDRFNYLQGQRWNGMGSVLGQKDFLTKYYSPVERFATMMDAMTLVDLHSRSVGYQVHHFSAFPWLLGEIEKDPHPDNIYLSQHRTLSNLHMDNDLETFKKHNLNIRTKHQYNDDDDHPTPLVHWIWARDYLAPEIGLVVDLDMEAQVHRDQARVLAGNA